MNKEINKSFSKDFTTLRSKKFILILVMVAVLLMPVGVRAMSVEQIADYQSYKPVGWNVYTGVEIDDSTAGFTINLGSGTNHTLIYLNSPDGTTAQWWVYVRMINSSVSTTTQIEPSPPSIRFTLQCGVSGTTYNLSTALPNSTWNTGYALFRLTWDTEGMIAFAYPSVEGNPLVSPTGKDLYTLNRDCYFEVFPDDWNDSNADIKVSVWNVNPSRTVLCNIDPAVASIESSTLGIIDINFQIWIILFDLFSVVVILLAIFGIPILLIKLVRWIFDEVKKMMGGRKVF
jgi:hypothetical protein